ncbi:MAG: helix-turn-helix domain-containing protein [Nitrospirota bacterium]
MIKRIENQDYYQILEVPYHASWGEIQKAYEFAKITYSKGAMGSYSLFDFAARGNILDKIEEAYHVLGHPEKRKKYDQALGEGILKPLPVAEIKAAPLDVHLATPTVAASFQPQQGVVHEKEVLTVAHPAPTIVIEPSSQSEPRVEQGVVDGKALKILRGKQGVTLSEIADQTRININYLEFIESNSYRSFPAPVYMMGYLKQYAKIVGLDSTVMDEYMKGYQKWLDSPGQKDRFQ